MDSRLRAYLKEAWAATYEAWQAGHKKLTLVTSIGAIVLFILSVLGFTLHFKSTAGLFVSSLSAVGAIGFLLFGAPVHLWRRDQKRISEFEQRLSPKMSLFVGDKPPFAYLQNVEKRRLDPNLNNRGRRFLALQVKNDSDLTPLSDVKVNIESIQADSEVTHHSHSLRRVPNENQTFNLRPGESKEVSLALANEVVLPRKIRVGYHERTSTICKEVDEGGCIMTVSVMSNESAPMKRNIQLQFVDGKFTATIID